MYLMFNTGAVCEFVGICACEECRKRGMVEFVLKTKDDTEMYVNMLSLIDNNSEEHIVNFGNTLEEMLDNTVNGVNIILCVTKLFIEAILNDKIRGYELVKYEVPNETDNLLSKEYEVFPNEHGG